MDSQKVAIPVEAPVPDPTEILGDALAAVLGNSSATGVRPTVRTLETGWTEVDASTPFGRIVLLVIDPATNEVPSP